MAVSNGAGRWMDHLKGRATKLVENNVNQASGCIRIGDIQNPVFYNKVCTGLGSSIDSAIAMNEVPSSSHLLQLPSIVKEVYRHRTQILQPSLMLLMLSIKAACRIGWFSDEDNNDLLMKAQEVGSVFSDTDKMNVEPSHAHSYFSNIISRFYPNMKAESILTSFDVKAGCGTYVADFHISRGMVPRHCRNLWLLVARMDNMDTAACITSPPNVDFLINGKGVPRRTRSDMGKGPQLPSNVTKIIKYGVNLLQVLGDFDGPYIVAVAFMNLISSPDPPQFQGYIKPMSGGIDTDPDVIEMSSRISLNCPISRHRIRTPVKGHLCKHPQCFDYKYFMEMNSRWPTWKCPLCNKPICNLDIRIDQNLLKILNEVEEEVSDVIISAEGLWTAAMEKTSEATETSQINNNNVPDTVEANCTFHNSASGSSPTGVSAQSPTTVTTDSPVPVHIQQFKDSRLQSQGSYTMVPTPPSMHQTRHHLNPVNLTNRNQPHQVQTNGTTLANISTTEQRHHVNLVNFTTTQASHVLTNPNQPHQVQTDGPTQATVSTSSPHSIAQPGRTQVAPNIRPGSSIRLPEPSGRMRGSLRGNELEAARQQFLAPPRQPARANEPWSRPTPTLPISLLMKQPPNNANRDWTNPPGTVAGGPTSKEKDTT